MAVPAPRDPRSCLVGPVSGAVKNIVRIACCCPHCPGLASTWKEQMIHRCGVASGLGWAGVSLAGPLCLRPRAACLSI